MKQSEPNSLQRALAQGEAGPHPDADVLTAFSEGALLPHEREGMLGHLALCAECRQVLSTAGGAAEPAAGMSIVGRKERAAWRIAGPLLAAAALIALATTVGIRYLLNRPTHNIAVAARKAEATAVVAPALPAPTPQAANQTEQKQSARTAAPVAAVPAPVVALREKAAGIGAASDRNKQAEAPRSESASPPTAPAVALSQAEVGAVANANSPQQRATPRPSSSNSQIALPKTDSPSPASAIANATTSRALAKAPSDSIARPRWRINAQGQPERAFGQGPWEPVPPSDARMQVLSVFGGEVWAGGDKSQVFRSTDNGATWHPVPLPEKDGTDHTIAHIRFDSAQEITIVAADGTTWSTTDRGTSWK